MRSQCTETEGKCNHRFDWLRTAVIPLLLIKHLSAPFFARLLWSSKGPRCFTSDLRSLNTLQVTAAKWAHCSPGTPMIFRSHVKRTLSRLFGSPALNDRLKPWKIVTLAPVVSSLAADYFCHAFPWKVVKEAFVFWVNAPQEAFLLGWRVCQKRPVSFLL